MRIKSSFLSASLALFCVPILLIIQSGCTREQARKTQDLKWMEGRWLAKTNGIFLVMEWTPGKDTLYGSGKVMGGGEMESTEEFKIYEQKNRLMLYLKVNSDVDKLIFRLTGDNTSIAEAPVFKNSGDGLEQISWEQKGKDSMRYITKLKDQPAIIYHFGKLVQ